MKRLIEWLTSRISPDDDASDLSLRDSIKSGAPPRPARTKPVGHTVKRAASPKQAVPKRQPDVVNLDPRVEGRIENRGPGKNVLVRNKYLREDTGTHETLKIVDDSILDTDEEEGFDPYNTGQFDRSRNWDRRRK